MLTFVLARTSAPFASSAPTTAKWPLKEARWSGVTPYCGAGEHRGQCLHPYYTLARTHECMHSLTLPIAHIHARSLIHATHTQTQTYTDTRTHAHTSTASMMRRAGIGTDTLHLLQRLTVDRVSQRARPLLTQARTRHGAQASQPRHRLERQQ
jgi:hypothetical protein